MEGGDRCGERERDRKREIGGGNVSAALSKYIQYSGFDGTIMPLIHS